MRRAAEAGVILINVLVVLGLAASIVYAMLTLADLSIARSQSFSEAGQGLALIRGGEQSAIAALRRDMVAAPETDNASEAWGKIAQEPIAIPGGSFALRIEDAQGRFNLNTLAEDADGTAGTDATEASDATDESRATEATEVTDDSAFGTEETAGTEVAGEPDADGTEATGEPDADGTEAVDDATGAQTPKEFLVALGKAADLPDDLVERIASSLALDGPLRRIGELKERVGIDPDQLARLAALATALPGRGEVNVNAAPEALLAVALDNPALASNLVNRRDRVGYLTAKDFEAAQKLLPQGFGFRSDFFWIRTTVRIGATIQSIDSLLKRQTGPEGPEVLVIERRNALAAAPPPPAT